MSSPLKPLTVEDHRRDSAGMIYVYPVVSRRAGGVSVGINLNPNNACNWHCIYCQVPDLVRGGPPPLNLDRMETELRTLLDTIVNGNFMDESVPEDARRLVDIAFSGNGEPTSAPEFPAAVRIVEETLKTYGLAATVTIRLITNGSLLNRASTRLGIERMGQAGGEVWFKLDAASPAAIHRINGTRQKPDLILRRLRLCASLCTTWVQSCLFAQNGKPPDESEIIDYLSLLDEIKTRIAGVHLYGLARTPQQPGIHRIERLPATWLENLANRIRARGLTVIVSP